MSTEALFWAMKQENLPPGPKFTLIMLADWYNDHESSAWPKHEQLAEKTGYSRRATQDHLYWLEKHGLVVAEKQSRAGRQIQNRYRLPVNVMAFQAAQNLRSGVAESAQPVRNGCASSNTIKDTIKDTPNCADAQEDDVKLAEMNLQGKKTKLEISAEAKRDSQGKLTPKGCGHVWRHARASAADDNGFQIELSGKALGQLKQLATRVGSDEAFVDIVWAVMGDWVGFTSHAESTSTAFKSPKDPNVDYFVKFIDAAADFAVEEDVTAGYKPKVKSIAKPLTNEPQKKDNGHQPMSKEEFMAISEEIGK